MAQSMYCSSCRKTIADNNFYTLPNGSKCELCKSCFTMYFDAFKPESFMWALEKFDVAYIEAKWNKTRDKEYKKALDKVTAGGSKNPQKDAYSLLNHGVIFGKYLGSMKLSPYNNYHWADTERLKQQAEEEARAHASNFKSEEEIDLMKEKFLNGEISEAEYLTYSSITQDTEGPQFELINGVVTTTMPGSGNDPNFPSNDNPFEKIDIPDVGASLTDEEKIKLAMKWGRLYSAADWVSLEQLYSQYDKSFSLHNADLIAGIKQVCKLDLKCNQALDSGDVDSYSKLARAADTLRKSLKLTEAQRKEEKTSNLDSIGMIVSFCEMHKDYIPMIDLSIDRDIVDKDIRDIKNYTRTLIEEDPTVFKQIEEYIKKREILLETEKNESDEDSEITDEDMTDYAAEVERQKRIDNGYDDDEEEDDY